MKLGSFTKQEVLGIATTGVQSASNGLRHNSILVSTNHSVAVTQHTHEEQRGR